MSMTRRNFFQVLAAAIGGLIFGKRALAEKAPEVKKQVVVAGNSILFDSAAFGTDACRPGIDTHYCDEVHPTNEQAFAYIQTGDRRHLYGKQ